MSKGSIKYSVKISVIGIKLELDEEGNPKEVNEADLYFDFRKGNTMFDPLTIGTSREGACANIPLNSELSEDKIQITARTKTEVLGSISIPQHIILLGGLTTYK